MKKYFLSVIIILSALLCACGSNDAVKISPVAQFSFETSLDDKGGNYSLIPYGDMSFNVSGISGNSLSLNGGYLKLNNELTLKNKFTFSAWINIKDFISYNPILFGNESSTGDIAGGPVSIYFNDNYTTLQCDLTFVTSDNQYKSYSFIASGVTLPEKLKQQWTHIVVTLNENVLKMYIDGVKVYDQSLPDDFGPYKSIATNSKPYTFGRSVYRNLDASIDEIKLYSVALTEEKIKEIFDIKISGYQNTISLNQESTEIKVNNQAIQLYAPMVTDNISGDILIPLKAFCNAIGANLTWIGDDGLGRLDIVFNNHNTSFWILNSNASFDGKHAKISPCPQTLNDIAYVPLSAFVESIGGIIKYNTENGTYNILY